MANTDKIKYNKKKKYIEIYPHIIKFFHYFIENTSDSNILHSAVNNVIIFHGYNNVFAKLISCQSRAHIFIYNIIIVCYLRKIVGEKGVYVGERLRLLTRQKQFFLLKSQFLTVF